VYLTGHQMSNKQVFTASLSNPIDNVYPIRDIGGGYRSWANKSKLSTVGRGRGWLGTCYGRRTTIAISLVLRQPNSPTRGTASLTLRDFYAWESFHDQAETKRIRIMLSRYSRSLGTTNNRSCFSYNRTKENNTDIYTIEPARFYSCAPPYPQSVTQSHPRSEFV
jgi:hypothetical protein